jgi:hypothetical protein
MDVLIQGPASSPGSILTFAQIQTVVSVLDLGQVLISSSIPILGTILDLFLTVARVSTSELA